ncbi:hypothetical protein [Magnetofaba australis]|uniref:Uncharacterized protein n=1 Tax=Magnetofaba australis IT-1 TaxID=1434232 RepID=A0A1Y2K8I1_9PROT|nr:hypothetical protein [Magnetofaba australis]OSM07048.1 hypothetical protein MAIT1_00040 [Magnetofaba australis IT-1]
MGATWRDWLRRILTVVGALMILGGYHLLTHGTDRITVDNAADVAARAQDGMLLAIFGGLALLVALFLKNRS